MNCNGYWKATTICSRDARSPGRPPVANRSHQIVFWQTVAHGLSSDDATFKAGVLGPMG